MSHVLPLQEEPHRISQSISSSTSTSAIDIDSDIKNNHLLSPKSKSKSISSLATVESVNRHAAPITASADGGENVEKKRPWYHPSMILDFLIGNWFLIGIGVVIVLAWRFPHVAADGGGKCIDTRVRSYQPLIRLLLVIRSQYSITYGVIAAIFLIIGLTLSTPALFHQLANWRLHLFTQIFSFLFFPAIVFAIVNCVRASGNEAIDKYVLAGMVVMSVMPTTVASNITMTRSAGGSTEAATMEVCVGRYFSSATS